MPHKYPFWFPVRKFDDPVGLHKNFRYLEDFMKTLNQGTPRSPSIIMAPFDTPYPERADVELSGTADNVKIQAALNELKADGGGWLHFLPGTILTSAQVAISHNNISLPIKMTGSGWSTVWKPTANMTSVFYALGAGGFHVSDIKFDGNGKTTTYLFQTANSTLLTVDNVWCEGASDIGFRMGAALFSMSNCLATACDVGYELRMRNSSVVAQCWATGNASHGFVATNSGGDAGLWHALVSRDNLGGGFVVNHDDVLVIGCHAYNNAGSNFSGTGTFVHNVDEEVMVVGDHTGLAVAGSDTTAIHDNVASEISAITAKATPAGSDFLVVEDSAAANVKKSVTVSALEAILSHDNIAGVSTDDHHAQAHTVVSHSDTTATGTELETLTDGSNADTLHVHAAVGVAFSELMLIGA